MSSQVYKYIAQLYTAKINSYFDYTCLVVTVQLQMFKHDIVGIRLL